MDDHDAHPEHTPLSETIVEGIGGAPGIAIGIAHLHRVNTPEVTRTHVDPEEVDAELDLLEEALDRASRDMEQIQSLAEDRLGEQGKALLEAQSLMLQDEEVLQAVRTRIADEQQSAAHALTTVLRQHRRRLEESEDEYLRERAGELEELEARLLHILQRNRTAASIQPHSIVVTDRLSAADLIRFSRHGMLGCVTTTGGETSHISIIARALDLPAVVGADGVLSAVSDRSPVVLDGHQGRLVVHPSEETLQRYREQRARRKHLRDAQTHREQRPSVTVDGQAIALRANVDFRETLHTLEQYGAEGIGLMRTEMLFLSDEGVLADEDRQTTVYRTAAETAGEHGATIRLLDVGGDKLFSLPQTDDNPFLGWRGIRLLLDRPDRLLRPQVRALLRANAHGTVRMLLPMVMHLQEVRRVRDIVEEEADRLAAQGVEHDRTVPLGAMVEVPATAVQADQFADALDFLSIGTNDLTQYMLAVDRGNDRVADRYDALHPAVLQLIRRTVEAGQEAGTPVSLCGELASDPHAVPLLIGLGLEALSVSPPSLPSIRAVISNTVRADAAALARDVQRASDAQTVRRRLREWTDAHYDAALFPGR